ncbi:L-seryl-tRNA(Sec) selenium transferase [Fuchsiella alkaliacetigena]|uniref:L-seryl-tRNA(Sec) selenium transferase n=1 Tax=Fuchsiella alkaliacetigena TaxID=957042 RepID=UPI00200A674D|nr:L-seryl-tRNA(Sec) selenium transferase [Fuchsiella alkaliacetigena]MCK8824833.1 L-seryl-tRNA(Sec) selenium transferase [Fuchsiella alkaliacetigena]
METYLRQIPAVNKILAEEKVQELLKDYPRTLIVDSIRGVNEQLRERILAGKLSSDSELAINRVVELLREKVKGWSEPNLRATINGTGVVIHTNLGRSLLAESAQQRLVEVADNYSNLEIEVESGERGSRYDNVSELLTYLTGAEAALVVNNNAAAVLLALDTLAKGQEVVISRGQLVEIGGSFRIPEVMEQSGAHLVEVGATNKTHLRDYEAAINEETALLLRAHTSNYRIVGFTKEVALEKLVKLSNDNNLAVLDDLGSGTLIDFSQYGFELEEPTVQESIEAGVDVVTFSGDKLLGGPQAGIIVGKEEYISRMKKNPLTRALRVDKFTLAALEETLRLYLDLDQVVEKVPTLRMLTLDLQILADKADKLKEALAELNSNLTIEKAEGYSQVGGGSFPSERLATYLIKVTVPGLTANQLANRLRSLNPPLFTRIQDEEIIIDLRTVKEEQISIIVNHFNKLLEGEGE